jgi:hypothetical protein
MFGLRIMNTRIPHKIKRSIEERLIDIKEDRFSQDTVKLFLIELREYLSPKSVLKEIAHFIAHPERNRGKILESVNYAYYRSRVLFRQLNENKTGKGLELDINNLPIDVYETVIWHHSKIKPNISKLNEFKKTFILDRTDKVYRPRKHLTNKILKTIKDAIGMISLQPALSQSDLIDEIVLALEAIGFNEYSDVIIQKQNSIMICLLAILHQSSFKLKDGNIAKAYLSNDPIINDLEGKVHISASVKTEFSNTSIEFTLISSAVTIKESFSQSMVNMAFGFPIADYKNNDYIDAHRNEKGTVTFVKHENAENIPEPVNSADPKGRAAD